MLIFDQLGARRERRRAALDAVALMRGVDPDMLKEAATEIKNGRFVVVGTMALRMRGYRVEAEDLDFLCESVPGGSGDGTGSGGSHSDDVHGVRVDYIYANKPRRKFLTRFPDVILGMPVASVKDVLGLKSFAGRPKDEKFLEWFRSTYMERAA